MKKLKMVIPKGRIYKNIIKLLNDAGFGIECDERVYIPNVELPYVQAKIMKSQNIPQIIELGSHDIGFTGFDWVQETNSDVKEVMDLGFDKVKIVAAVPENLVNKDLTKQKIVVASEYENISTGYLKKENYNYVLLKTFGATEVFPPDDADMIIDNVSTGRTLKANNLKVVSTILESSTRFIANKDAIKDPWKKEKIDEIKMLFQAVIDARGRVMLEMNIPNDKLNGIIGKLPCMRYPTISSLYGENGYAVKIAVKKNEIANLIPELNKMGATDILEYELRKVII